MTSCVTDLATVEISHIASTVQRGNHLPNFWHPMWNIWHKWEPTNVSDVPKEIPFAKFMSVNVEYIPPRGKPLSKQCQPKWHICPQGVIPCKILSDNLVYIPPRGNHFSKLCHPMRKLWSQGGINWPPPPHKVWQLQIKG